MIEIEVSVNLTQVNPADYGLVLEGARREAIKQVEMKFLQAIFQIGVARGRDIEYRTQLDHERGMKKLAGGD